MKALLLFAAIEAALLLTVFLVGAWERKRRALQ